jgi:ATP-binding cassette subfamily B protein
MNSSLWRVVATPVRAEAGALTGSGLLSMLRIAADLARPWPLAIAIDVAIDGRPGPAWLPAVPGEQLLVLAGVASVVVTAASAYADRLADREGERAAQRIGARLRGAVFAQAVTLSLRWHFERHTGELVSRLTSDVGRILDAVVAATVTLVPDLVAVVAVLGLLLAVDPHLALLGLAVVPVLAVLSARQRRAARTAQRDARSAAGRLTGTTTELVRHVAAVQAFGRTDQATRSFAARNRDLLDREVAAVDTEARWAPRSSVVLAAGAGIVLVVGGLQVRSGAQSTGHLLVVLAYLAELYAPVRGLTRLSVVLAKASVSADRVDEVLSSSAVVVEPVAPLALPAVVDGLRFDGVRFGYDPAAPVLEGFDLEVRRGEIVCLFGPSGAGKSTVLALLLRLWDVDDGRVSVGGADVRDLRLSELRRAIAYVPQDPWLLDATVAENIAFGSRDATRAGVLRAGGVAGVDEFAGGLPLGYDTRVGEGASRLSGGQRRRVAIARAVVRDAPVLLLDEPTSSLDLEAARRVVEAIHEAAAHRATLVVTHDPLLAGIADRVVHLGAAADDPSLVTVGRR